MAVQMTFMWAAIAASIGSRAIMLASMPATMLWRCAASFSLIALLIGPNMANAAPKLADSPAKDLPPAIVLDPSDYPFDIAGLDQRVASAVQDWDGRLVFGGQIETRRRASPGQWVSFLTLSPMDWPAHKGVPGTFATRLNMSEAALDDVAPHLARTDGGGFVHKTKDSFAPLIGEHGWSLPDYTHIRTVAGSIRAIEPREADCADGEIAYALLADIAPQRGVNKPALLADIRVCVAPTGWEGLMADYKVRSITPQTSKLEQ